jgi:hypothetical protein
MSDELARLEAERIRLIDMANAQTRQKQVITTVTAIVTVVIVVVVILFVISAVWAGQLGVTGLLGATVAAALLFFVLSRKIVSETHRATIADVIFGLVAQPTNDPIRAQIAEHEMRIARLKAGEKK